MADPAGSTNSITRTRSVVPSSRARTGGRSGGRFGWPSRSRRKRERGRGVPSGPGVEMLTAARPGLRCRPHLGRPGPRATAVRCPSRCRYRVASVVPPDRSPDAALLRDRPRPCRRQVGSSLVRQSWSAATSVRGRSVHLRRGPAAAWSHPLDGSVAAPCQHDRAGRARVACVYAVRMSRRSRNQATSSVTAAITAKAPICHRCVVEPRSMKSWSNWMPCVTGNA